MANGSPKKGKDIYMWILIAVVVFLAAYLIFSMWCRREGLDSTGMMLVDTIGGNYNANALMTTSMPADFMTVNRNDLAEDDALDYFCNFTNQPMRVGKSLAYQDAMVNRYTKVKEAMGA